MLSQGLQTVFIEGTNFVMGSAIQSKRDAQYHQDEVPIAVSVPDFRIGTFPVTAEQLCAFLNSAEAKKHAPDSLYFTGKIGSQELSTVTVSNGVYVPAQGAAQAPVNQVTWKGAVLFCEWLSAKTGKTYRLPSEAEWELAARGANGRKYPWGNQSPTADKGERYAPYGSPSRPANPMTPVGSYPCNSTPEGVMDLLAYTIGEWCCNRYVASPEPKAVQSCEIGLDDLRTHRVVRGYYMRPKSKQAIPFPFMNRGQHLGCGWTRYHCHPIDEVRRSARHGFRVVEEVVPE